MVFERRDVALHLRDARSGRGLRSDVRVCDRRNLCCCCDRKRFERHPVILPNAIATMKAPHGLFRRRPRVCNKRPPNVVALPVAIQVLCGDNRRGVLVDDPPGTGAVRPLAIRVVEDVQLRRLGFVVRRAAGRRTHVQKVHAIEEALVRADTTLDPNSGWCFVMLATSNALACATVRQNGRLRECQGLFDPFVAAIHTPRRFPRRHEAELGGV
mmetsp:Transcript_104113/g.301187  ORF Transcript_104113/g.301187 Transcript_104113/m.301187 type:complete len:213 (+) Transcript_104113:489-1127(+)